MRSGLAGTAPAHVAAQTYARDLEQLTDVQLRERHDAAWQISKRAEVPEDVRLAMSRLSSQCWLAARARGLLWTYPQPAQSVAELLALPLEFQAAINEQHAHLVATSVAGNDAGAFDSVGRHAA